MFFLMEKKKKIMIFPALIFIYSCFCIRATHLYL